MLAADLHATVLAMVERATFLHATLVVWHAPAILLCTCHHAVRYSIPRHSAVCHFLLPVHIPPPLAA